VPLLGVILDTNAARDIALPLLSIISNVVGAKALVPLAVNVIVHVPPAATVAQGAEVCVTFAGNWVASACTLLTV